MSIEAMQNARRSLDRTATVMALATAELDKRQARIQKLEAILEEIKDNIAYHEVVLALCESGLK